jgi:hypothetical protein
MQSVGEPGQHRKALFGPGTGRDTRPHRWIARLTGWVFGSGFGVWLVFLLFLAAVQLSTPDLPGNDGYYHIRLASLMRTEGLKPAFPWLPLTILNPREYYDHHFLYHVALIPFTFGDLREGAKWASVLFASLTFLAFWRLLKKQDVLYPGLWALGLLAVSEAFIYRMSLPRAQSLSFGVLVLAVHWLLHGKHLRLFFLAFVYVWLYNAFPLLLLVSGAYVLAGGLTERRWNMAPLVYTAAGLLLGSFINPYFPYNLLFAYQHILPKILEPTSVSVGSEWYPYTTGQLIKNSPLALLAFLSSFLALGFTPRRINRRTLTAFLLACLFGFMLFQSRRFVEYFPPFALLLAAFAWNPLLVEVRERLNTGPPVLRLSRVAVRSSILPAALLVILLPFALFTLSAAQKSIRTSQPYQLYQGASEWLKTHSPPGERIFQTDWDDFPRLFFYNTHNTYLVGLDPTYLQLADPALYDLWVEITRGEVDSPSRHIAADFGSRFVLSDLEHEGFLFQARKDPYLLEVYRDEEAVIFEVASSIP